jgi:hypothetical protein
MYLSVITYKDITSAASILSQISTTYSKQHWNAAKRVLRYLKWIKNKCWKYRVEGKISVNITDIDRKGDKSDHRFSTEVPF